MGGQQITVNVQAPTASSLDPGSLQLAVFKSGESTPVATASGGSLNFLVPEAGEYSVSLKTPGVSGNHLVFDGSDGVVNLGNPNALQITGDQTIEFWMRADAIDRRENPFEKAYGGEGTVTLETSGILNYYYGNSGRDANSYETNPSGATLRRREWTHVAVVRDFGGSPSQVRWYFDGKLAQARNVSISPAVAGAKDFLIGDGYAGNFTGAIDEFRVWNTARSAAEIEAGMAMTLVGNEAGLVAYYQFEEASGTTVTDSTANGLDGTMSGGVTRQALAGADISELSQAGIGSTYLITATVTDLQVPVVLDSALTPFNNYIFDGTSQAPGNMVAQRGNDGSEFLYTVRGSSSGTLRGIDLYSDDSSIAAAAVHAGILYPGELGAVRVTVRPPADEYQEAIRNGVASSYWRSAPGSFEIERYEPVTPFTLSAIYREFSIRFSERVNQASLIGATSLIAAGTDGLLGTGDDEAIPLTFLRYLPDHRVVFGLDGRILESGSYRIQVSTTLADLAGNTIPAPYTKDFVVSSPGGFTIESGLGNNRDTADTLSLNVEAGVFDGSFSDGNQVTGVSDAPFALEAADLDGDGNIDAVTGHRGSGDRVNVHPGNGDGSFGTALEFPSGGGDIWGVTLVDLDKDGKTDIVVAARSGDKLVVLTNTSTPGALSFVQSEISVGDDPLVVVTEDFNGDAWPDLAVTNYGSRNVSLILSDGSGGFLPESKIAETDPVSRPYGAAAGDLNNDTFADLVLGDDFNSERIVVLLGAGDGSFGAPAFYDFPSGWSPSSVAMADFDQDGAMDLGVTQGSFSASDYSIYPGLGDGTFGDRINIDIAGRSTFFQKVSDYTGDGWPDVLISGYEQTSLLQNRADGVIGFATSRRNPTVSYAADLVDLDGDDLPDLLVSDENADALRVYRGRPRALLVADDSNVATGLQHGYGRGFLSSSSDRDWFSFTAKAGQRVNVASDTTVIDGASLRYTLYDEVGTNLASVNGGAVNQSGQVIIPRDGTYFVEVSPWNAHYNREYRFRVTLAPVGSGQQETENNNSIGNSDALALELSGNQLSGRIYGFASTGDTADYFALGNLAAQTEIRIRLDLPQTSTISTSTLRLFKGDGSEVTPNQVTPTELVHVVAAGENSTYFVALSSAEKGLLAEYFLNASLVDFVPPFIVADNLPDNTEELIHSFSLNFNKDMSAPTVTDSGNYSLIWSGPDLELSTADDEVIGLVPSYSSGLSASFAIVNGPLLPGSYEFRASGLTDTFGNTLAVLYQRNFEVISRGVDQTEVEPNQSAATATALVLNDFIPGYVTAHGRGSLRTGSNDYWSFEALGGDVLIFEPFLSQANSSTSLNYQLIAPDGSSLWSRQQSNSGIESQPPTTLPQDGRYVLRISQWNAYREEYRFRIALLDGSIGYEVEPNGVFPDASPVNFEPVNSIDTASQAGFVSRGTELDYFNLGVIDPGTTVFLSVRKPDGSVLTPIVSLYSSGGSLMSEVDGSSTDGVAEIRITSSDTYYALIQANLGSFGYAADYIFDIRKLPTDQVDFPNLQVTAVTDLPATGLRTGSSVPVTYTVTNTGSLGTGTGQWIDRIYISGNDVLGDDDDIQLAVVPHSGLLAASAGYTETQSITLPDGLPGTFHVIVETDGANTVDEVFKEGDNDLATSSTFDVTLQDSPDLVIEDLILSGPDSENRYTFDFNLANRGSGLAVGGSHRIGVQVLNASTSGVVLQDSLEVPNDLPADGIAPVSTSVVATVPGFYLVTLTADADQQLYEFGAGDTPQPSRIQNRVTSKFFNFMTLPLRHRQRTEDQ